MQTRTMMCSLLLACIAPAGLDSAASAAVTTYQFDLPTQPLGIFGVEYSADHIVPSNPIIGGEIVDVRIHLEFSTFGSAGNLADAANLEIQFQPPAGDLPFWTISGADLGWSGTGTDFVGDASTSSLNLPIIPLPPDSLSLWFIRIINNNDAAPLLGGQLTNSYIEVDISVIPAPASAVPLGFFALWSRSRRRR